MEPLEVIFRLALMACPCCGRRMLLGFSCKSSPLSFVPLEKMRRFVFKDEDLHHAGLKVILPWKAEYSPSYHCSHCRVYVIDYGKVVASSMAKSTAATLEAEIGDRNSQ
jgi:hypothetical protein